MTYIENVFFCLAAPLLVAVFCMDRARQYDFSKMAEAYLEVYESLF